jgi:hypothetical protein
VHAKLKAKSFAEELYQMATRCMKDATSSTSWSLPPAVHTAICKHTTAKAERFATPLDVHLDSEKCWSPYKRDALFGFKHDAYKCQWRGASVATPPSQPEEVLKALTHAIRSAKAADHHPVLTTLIVPAWSEALKSGYNNLLNANTGVCNI